MISRIKQKSKQIFSWYNRDSIETNKGKEASAMGRHSKTVIEYRSYEFPPHFPLRVIAGEEWRISDVPSGVLHFHNCLEIGICESDSGKMNFSGKVVPLKPGILPLLPGMFRIQPGSTPAVPANGAIFLPMQRSCCAPFLTQQPCRTAACWPRYCMAGAAFFPLPTTPRWQIMSR